MLTFTEGFRHPLPTAGTVLQGIARVYVDPSGLFPYPMRKKASSAMQEVRYVYGHCYPSPG